jgi:hypothetical protein
MTIMDPVLIGLHKEFLPSKPGSAAKATVTIATLSKDVFEALQTSNRPGFTSLSQQGTNSAQSEAKASSGSVVVNSADGAAGANPTDASAHSSSTVVSYLGSTPSTTVPEMARGSLKTLGVHRRTRERGAKYGTRVRGDRVSTRTSSSVALATHSSPAALAVCWYRPPTERCRGFNTGLELAVEFHADNWAVGFWGQPFYSGATCTGVANDTWRYSLEVF